MSVKRAHTASMIQAGDSFFISGGWRRDLRDVGVRHTQAVHHADGGGGNSEGHVELGKREVAMREVLGAGRGVQAGEVEIPAMASRGGKRDAAGSSERRGERRMRRGTRLRTRTSTQHNILSRKAL